MDENKNKQPRICVGAFIFNDKEELFMMKSAKWQNQYMIPGGGVKTDEVLEEALIREIKEETKMDIENIKFLSIYDGSHLGSEYTGDSGHLVFINYKAKFKGKSKIKLNKEASAYKWRSVEEWLNEKSLQPDIKKVITATILKEAQSEYFQEYQRALADYQNLVKQTAQEKIDFVKYANEQLLYKLIPIYDNLKISIQHNDKEKADAWLEGVKYVVKQFKTALGDVGVEEIETDGKKFDPITMEAVEGSGETVTKEVKPGYKLNGKVIIPAKVIVGG